MVQVFTVSTAKGGVLKTTSTANLAGALALDSKKVLLLDFDGQGNLSDSFGIFAEEYPGKTMAEVLLGQADLADCLVNVAGNLWIVPADVGMSFFDLNAYQRERPLELLKNVFERELDFIRRFDYIFIDTPPNLSIGVLNAFNVSNYVLIPFQPETFGKRSLIRTIETLIQTKQEYKMDFELKGVFATLVHNRVNVHKANIEEVREWAENNHIRMFDTVIKQSSLFATVMELEQLPLVLSNEGRKRKNRHITQMYLDLKGEIIDE